MGDDIDGNRNLADDVARLVVDSYLKLPQRFRVKSTEWTVLCGIVAEEESNDASTRNKLRLVSMGTGTKCLSDATLVDGYVVRDCHAETMARRGLNVVIMNEIESFLKADSGSVRLLEEIKKEDGKVSYKLRRNTKLHMYVSDSPCGCASEYLRVQGESSRVTGAKRFQPSHGEDTKAAMDDDGLRTKSGRSDLPADRRTRCMSCSDKLTKWAAIGLQCSITALAGLSEPIRLSSIVLGRDAALGAYEDPSPAFDDAVLLLPEAIANVTVALERCLSRKSVASEPPEVLIAARVGFPQSRQRLDPPKLGKISEKAKSAPSSGVALTWICMGGGRKREVCPKANGGGFAETIVGVRGVREGASKSAASHTVSSDLSKAMWLKWFLKFEGGEACTNVTYKMLKHRAGWHRALVDGFRKAFPGWNVNEEFDEFIVDA